VVDRHWVNSLIAAISTFVALGILGVGAPTAQATAPTLVSVGQTSGHITATWSLAAGQEARVIEAATSPATGSDGYFFFENVKTFSTLTPTQTTYTDTYQNDPGVYYVHLASMDPDCLPCPVREWSNVMTVTIPAPAPPPTSLPPATATPTPIPPPTPAPTTPVVAPTSKTCTVPRVAGLSVKTARVRLARAGCDSTVIRVRSRRVKRGRAISTRPGVGRQTSRLVVLLVSRGR
jgi:hypothetical protein